MADHLPDPPAAPGGKRRWHRYASYRLVHEQQHDALRTSGVVVRDTVTFNEIRTGDRLVEVNVKGRVKTRSGAVVVVNKWLEVRSQRGRIEVRTREYDYHAFIRGPRRDLFRYDNCHGGPETLHRHPYDVSGGAQEACPIRQDEMPTLADVIRQADWLARYLRRRLRRSRRRST